MHHRAPFEIEMALRIRLAQHESERIRQTYYRPVAAFVQAIRAIGETTAIANWIRLFRQWSMDCESYAPKLPLWCQSRVIRNGLFQRKRLIECRPNGTAFSCRERAARASIKKPPILRAKRSTATPGSAAADSTARLESFVPLRRISYSDHMLP